MLTEVKNIPPSTYLSHELQDWFSTVGLMERREFSEGLSIFEPNKKLTHDEDVLSRLLSVEFGYIAPMDILSASIGKDAKAVSLRVLGLKRKLVDRGLLCNAHDIGYGYGVDNFKLGHLGVFFIRGLFDHIGHWVSEEDIVRYVYGRDDEIKDKQKSFIRDKTRELNSHYLEETQAKIEYSSRFNTYRLVDGIKYFGAPQVQLRTKETKQVKEDPIISEDCLLDLNFHNWMTRMGIIKPLENLADTELLKLREGERLFSTERDFFEIIAGYPFRVLDKRTLARTLYNNYDQIEEVIALGYVINALKKKLLHPKVFSSPQPLFFGFGIDKFALTQTTMRLCYTLWSEFGQWVDVDDLADALYGQDRDDKKTLIESQISILRRQFRFNEVSLNIKNSSENGYKLVNKK